MQPSVLERIAAGDQAAVQTCLDMYGNLVWSLARRYLGAGPSTEDAVQDVFVSVWKSASRYKKSLGSEVTFIATITRRRLVDRIRKNARRPDITSLTDDSGNEIDIETASCLEGATDVQIASRIVGQMRPQIRRILSMSLFEGYTHTEIADRLEIPLGTVKTRIRRALADLRQQLQEARIPAARFAN